MYFLLLLVFFFLEKTVLKHQSTMDDYFKPIFMLLSKEIGKDWKKLGRCLSLKNPELENIEIKNSDLEDKTYEMLLLWFKNQKRPTLDALVTALKQVPRMDLIEMIKPSTTSIFY